MVHHGRVQTYRLRQPVPATRYELQRGRLGLVAVSVPSVRREPPQPPRLVPAPSRRRRRFPRTTWVRPSRSKVILRFIGSPAFIVHQGRWSGFWQAPGSPGPASLFFPCSFLPSPRRPPHSRTWPSMPPPTRLVTRKGWPSWTTCLAVAITVAGLTVVARRLFTAVWDASTTGTARWPAMSVAVDVLAAAPSVRREAPATEMAGS